MECGKLETEGKRNVDEARSADEVRSTEMDALQVRPAAERRATRGGHPLLGGESRKWTARGLR